MSKTQTHRNQMQRKEAATGYLCLLPNFIGFAIFTVIPVIMGFLISLTDYNGFPGFKFVGFSNYTAMFQDTLFTTALKNNLIYSFSVVPLTLLTALLLALALNRGAAMNGFFKTVYFFPNLTSMVAVSCVAMMIFQPADGIVNQLLEFFGVAEKHLPQWFNATSTALFTVIIVVVWKSAGYYMIILMGGLKNIPAHLYEAAKIDGADTWQCFWNVTWPMLSPTTFMVTILCFISSFQVFDIIQITTDGGPGRATTVLVYRIYKEAFQNWKMGYASAIAYFLFLIIFVITLVQWHGQKKWVND
ncbi:carbohydrate ABC transporter permease [Clostridium sp. Marseille-P2415]|uniref:carbohydrate ABC transporter permease n=1 Tax=Clostridium sp. Marseille-P2415 TaxID=1805471 RepID=UPI0009888AED|nr:sugar ABC transporter permease [Clostridium sp. Marseille-P2415]